MKKFLAVLCILFAGVFGTARAFACNSGEIDVEGTCVSGKFAVKTTNLNANDTVNFTMTAVGTFSVNCGDGGTLSGSGVSGNTITRSGTSKTTYTCTYSTGGSKIIAFDGTATSYSTAYMSNNSYTNDNYAVLGFFGNTKIAKFFGDLSELLPQYGTSMAEYPRFINACRNCTNLVSIPAELFSNYTGGASMFVGTFLNIGITSIPSGLFDGITNAPTRIFSHTFYGCTALTSIPSDLFRNVTSAADYAFNQTFANCTGLTSIPDDLFGGITGASTYMFNQTFYNDANITGYIPKSTFAGLIDANSPTASGMWYQTFNGTQLSSSCTGNMNEVQTTYKGTTAGTQWGNYAMCDAPSGPRITYEMNGGTNYVGAPTTYVEGTGVTIDGIPTKSGYTFAGWCTDSELTNCAMTQTIGTTATGDKTYYAKWTACTACAATNASCELSVVNNTCTYTTACNTGYENIQNNGAYNASCTLIPPTYNITYDLGGACAVAVAPSGYTQLEYIQTTGTQYIDTGISPDTSTKWVLDTEFVTVGTNGVVQLGNNGDSSAGGYFRFDIGARSGGGLNLNLGPVVTVNANDDFLNQRMTYMIDAPNMTWAYGNTSGSYTVNPGTPSPSGRRTIVIGARHIASSGIDVNPPQVKIYSSQIYTDGTLVQNLIPVRRNSDNVLGMYDVVSDTFKTFSGSSLLAGDPINPSVCENYNNAPATYTYGVGATVNGIPTRPYYTFAGWCTDSELTNCAMTQTIGTDATGDKTFYAKWTSNSSYTVTYSCGTGATGNPPSSETVMDGASFTPSDNDTCAKTGYTFNGWNDGTTDRLVGTAYTYNYDDDVTLTATWAANTYNITLSNGELSIDLPSGYTQLEYIQTNGSNSYIDTGHAPTMATKWELDSEFITCGTSGVVEHGSGGTSSAGGYWRFDINASCNGNFGLNLGPVVTVNANDNFLNQRMTYVIDAPNMQWSYGNTTGNYTLTPGNPTDSWTILIGARHTGANGVENYNNIKVYSSKLYSNGTLIQHLVPAKRNSDGVVGMYDIVNNIFRTKSGSGNLTEGPTASSFITYTYGVGATIGANDAGTRNGYIFAGWCTDSELTNCAMTQTIGTDATGDKTFYAKWTACTACAATNASCELSVVNNTCTYTTACESGYVNIQNNGAYNASCTATYNITLNNISEVPSEYTELEYLTSNGTQYIDTGFKPNQDTHVVMQYMVTTNPLKEFLFGTRNVADNAAGSYGVLYGGNGTFASDYDTIRTQSCTITNNYYNQKLTVDKNKNIAMLYNDAGSTLCSETSGAVTFQSTYNLLFPSLNNGGTFRAFSGSIQVYSFKIYDDGTLVHDFIPARRNSDDVLGMYDTVTGTFFTNSGTDTFAAGPALNMSTYIYGVGATINEVPARDGYTFAGWCTDSELTNCAMTQTIGTTASGDKTFYAKWTQCTPCAATNASCELSVVNNTCTYMTACNTGYENIQNNGAYNASCTLIPPTYNITLNNIGNSLSGYTELEYLQSTGTQYIDTGFMPNQDTRVLITFKVNGNLGGHMVFYDRETINGTQVDFGEMLRTLVWRSSYGPNVETRPTSAMINQKVTIDKDKNVSTMYDASGNVLQTHTLSATTFQYSQSMPLFGFNNAGTMGATDASSVIIYSAKIYDDGTLVHDFIPARRNSDDVLGMYDTVTGTFFTNDGTGTFTAGPVVPNYTTQTYTYGVGTILDSNDAGTRNGYIFAGWCTDSELTNCAMTQTIGTDATGDKTFYAKWMQGCSLGYYYTNNICTICPINNYCADGYSAVACAAGLYSPVGMWESAQCGRILHIGDEVVYLRASKITPHALHVDVDHDGVADYFGNMTTADVVMHAGSERKLKVKMSDTVYSIYDDTVTLPTE